MGRTTNWIIKQGKIRVLVFFCYHFFFVLLSLHAKDWFRKKARNGFCVLEMIYVMNLPTINGLALNQAMKGLNQFTRSHSLIFFPIAFEKPKIMKNRSRHKQAQKGNSRVRLEMTNKNRVGRGCTNIIAILAESSNRHMKSI